MDVVTSLLVVFAVLLGAVVGSFLNVCIWRLPREGLSVSRPRRSHCPVCGNAISWFDNVPVLSWIWLRGRCRECTSPISIRYLVVEALTAMLFGVLAFRYLRADELLWAEFLVLATLIAALIVASVVDIDLHILPDEITLVGMLAVPFVALFVPGLHTRPPDLWIWSALDLARGYLGGAGAVLPEAFRGPMLAAGIAALLAAAGVAAGVLGFRLYWRVAHPGVPNRLADGALAGVLAGTLLPVLWLLVLHPDWSLRPEIVSYTAALAGMATGAGLVLVVGIVGSLIFGKDAMGFGDVKLMGLLGGVAGFRGVLAGFAIACLLGSIVGVWRMVRYRTRYLWFGPFLSTGCVIVILLPEALLRALNWYLGLFR